MPALPTVTTLAVQKDEKTRIKRKDDFILQDVGGENLLVPLGEHVMDWNGLVTLNGTGACLWNLLAQERSVDELAGAVAEHFDVDPKRALVDVQNFLEEMTRLGVLEK